MRSDLVHIDMCSDLVFGGMCSIVLPTMRFEIFCSLSWLIVVGDGRGFGYLTQLREFYFENRCNRDITVALLSL